MSPSTDSMLQHIIIAEHPAEVGRPTVLYSRYLNPIPRVVGRVVLPNLPLCCTKYLTVQ